MSKNKFLICSGVKSQGFASKTTLKLNLQNLLRKSQILVILHTYKNCWQILLNHSMNHDDPKLKVTPVSQSVKHHNLWHI